jgi:hypothetical protein
LDDTHRPRRKHSLVSITRLFSHIFVIDTRRVYARAVLRAINFLEAADAPARRQCSRGCLCVTLPLVTAVLRIFSLKSLVGHS